jgi:replication factor A1
MSNMNDLSAALSRIDAGCLEDIFNERPGRVQHPVVQAAQIKPIAAQGNNPERHRVILNDTKNYVQTMLAVQENNLIEEKILRKGVLVQLLAYTSNRIKSKRYVRLKGTADLCR